MSDRYGLGIENPDGYSPLSQLGSRFIADGPGVEAVEAREAQAARDAWAARVSNQARPLGGREEGLLTEYPDLGLIPRSPMDFALLALGGPFSRAAKIGALALGGLLESTEEAQAGKLPRFGWIDRARKMGYADDVFYRGELSGTVPTEFRKGAHFSRWKEYADDIARKGGATDATEYRLKLDRTLSDGQNLTAAQYGRLVKAAQSVDPKLAKDLAEIIAPEGQGHAWIMNLARSNPDAVVTNGAAFVRQAIERSRAPEKIFKRAGFDALDSGRDVRKLTGDGIRQVSAEFDPAKARSRNTLASIFGLGSVPIAEAVHPHPNPD